MFKLLNNYKKEQMREKLRNTKGITLIALVVTIIILLILAGVAINIAIGENGLFNKSKQVVEKYQEEAAREKLELGLMSYELAREEDPFIWNKETVGDLLEREVGCLVEDQENDVIKCVVDGYAFLVDTTKPEIIESLGKDNGKRIEVESIELNPTEGTVEIGREPANITAIVKPNDATNKQVRWTTEDALIAEVKSTGTNTAEVKGVSTGETKIIATAGGVRAEYRVTVKGVDIEGIEVSKSNIEMIIDGEEEITATVTPTDATDKSIKWISMNEEIVKIDGAGEDGVKETTEGSIKIIATGVGETTIKVRAGSITKDIRVIVKGIEIETKFEPNGSEQWKQTHTIKVSANDPNNRINGIKYIWSEKDNGITEADFEGAESYSNGEIKEHRELTGTYYLWTMVIMNGMEPCINKSSAYKFDNKGPKIEEPTTEGISDKEISLSINAIDEHIGTLSKYEIYMGQDKIKEGTAGELINPVLINVASYGEYDITVKVYDSLGNDNAIDKHVSTKLYSWKKYSYLAETYKEMYSRWKTTSTHYPYPVQGKSGDFYCFVPAGYIPLIIDDTFYFKLSDVEFSKEWKDCEGKGIIGNNLQILFETTINGVKYIYSKNFSYELESPTSYYGSGVQKNGFSAQACIAGIREVTKRIKSTNYTIETSLDRNCYPDDGQPENDENLWYELIQ